MQACPGPVHTFLSRTSPAQCSSPQNTQEREGEESPPSTATFLCLKDGHTIDGTGDAARNIVGDTGDEEAPAILPLTLDAQLLQVEQLADITAPAGQEDLVHAPVIGGGPALEARVVAGDGAEVVPDPAEDVIGLFDAAEARGREVGQAVELGGLRLEHVVVGLEEAGADDEHVAEPRRRVVLPLQRLQQPLELDARRVEAVKAAVAAADNVLAGPFVHPPPEIHQDAPAHDAAVLDRLVDPQHIRVLLAPVARARNVLDRRVVVEPLRLLVPKVAEPIPLRRALRVEGPRVVVHNPRLLLVHVLLEHLPPEERFGPLEVQRRVQRHPHAGFDLAGRRGGDHCGRLPVEEPQFVVLAVRAPCIEPCCFVRFV